MLSPQTKRKDPGLVLMRQHPLIGPLQESDSHVLRRQSGGADILGSALFSPGPNLGDARRGDWFGDARAAGRPREAHDHLR